VTGARVVLLSLSMIAILAIVVAWPVVQSLLDALAGDGAFAALFDPDRPAAMRALWNSAWTSVASVVLAGAFGTGLAILVARIRFPFRGALAALAVLPLLLPPIVGVLTFKQFLFGEYGLVAEFARRVLGVSLHLDGIPGVLALHTYAFFPFFFLFVSAGLQRVDPALEQAAVSLGASRATTLRRVVLPLLVPALAGAAVLVLLNSMGSFSAPLFFAPAEEFMTLRIYNSRESDPAGAAALSTILAIAACLLLVPLRLFERARTATSSASKGVAAPTAPPFGRIGQWICAAFACGLVLVLLLPHLSIVVLSFSADTIAQTSVLPTDFTLQHWQRIFEDEAFLRPLRNSAWMAGAAALADLVLGLGIALLLADRRAPGRTLIELLALLPMALPATVLAFNLVRAFGAATPLTLGHALGGTIYLLPLAYFVRHLPIALRATQSALATLDPALIDAATSFGASRLRTFARIVFPLVAPGVLSGVLLCFLSGLTEFVASILIFVPENLPIAVEIFNRQYNRALGEPAALSVLLLVTQALVLLIAHRFLRLDRAR
jgi:iron(III) transport system permease protein